MRLLNLLVLSSAILHYIGEENDSLLRSREGGLPNIFANVSTFQEGYMETEADLIVSAPDSLIFSRFYSGGDTFDIAQFWDWRFHFHCSLPMQKDPKRKDNVAGEKRFGCLLAYTSSPEGSISIILQEVNP